jgi:hypothetical protein
MKCGCLGALDIRKRWILAKDDGRTLVPVGLNTLGIFIGAECDDAKFNDHHE